MKLSSWSMLRCRGAGGGLARGESRKGSCAGKVLSSGSAAFRTLAGMVSTEGPQRQSGNQIPECLALTDVGSRVNLKEDTDVKRKSWFGRF